MKTRTYYPWVVVGLLWFVALLNYLDRQMLATMRDSMMIDIDDLHSAANFGRLMAVFLWVYGLMSPMAGMIADRISRKRLIVGSLFIWSLVTFLMGYATGYTELYLLRALMGVSEALYMPAGLSLIADYHRDKTRSLAVGLHLTGLYVGQALGGFGATWAAMSDWHTVFHGFGAVGIGYSLVLMVALKDYKRPADIPLPSAPQGKPPVLKGLTLLLSNISFWVILLYFTVPSLPGWAVKNWLPTLLSDSLSIPMPLAGPLATMTTAGASLVGVVAGGLLSDRWVMRTVRGRVYTGALGLGLTIPALLLLGFSHSLAGVTLGGLCFGLGFGMFDANNMPIVCQFVSSRYRATAYGLMNMAGICSGAFITSLLGRSVDAGHLGRDFILMGGVVALVIALQLIVLRPRYRDMPDRE